MRSNIPLHLLFLSVIFITASSVAQAQSTLEYSTLISAVGAAGSSAKKEKSKDQNEQGQGESSNTAAAGIGAGIVGPAIQKVYGDTEGVLSRSGSMMGQIGSSAPANPQNLTVAPETKPVSPSIEKASVPSNVNVKVYLKSGNIIEGKIVGQDDHSVKIDTDGIPVTYFNEEISRIEKSPTD